MVLYGLDGCKKNAWVVAESDSELRSVSFRVETDLRAIVLASAGARAVAVLDVPIGLSHSTRACDAAARQLLQHRHVCVFTPPCREALTAASYEQAVAANRLHCNGAAISVQSFNIRERIKLVDDLVTPGHQKYLKEAHPEVVFALLNGAIPLELGKNTADGVAKRMALLTAAGVPSFDPMSERKHLGLKVVSADDVVDAAAMLLTARDVARGTASRLPPDADERDERGLAMEMWAPAVRSTGSMISKSGRGSSKTAGRLTDSRTG